MIARGGLLKNALKKAVFHSLYHAPTHPLRADIF